LFGLIMLEVFHLTDRLGKKIASENALATLSICYITNYSVFAYAAARSLSVASFKCSEAITRR
jgi:hypothetical protein